MDKPFLELSGDYSIFQGLLVMQKQKRCYWGVTGHPHYKLEANLVTPTQLQDGLPLTGMSGAVILSAMLLTEFSLLHPNNPWILSIAMYFGQHCFAG